MPDTGPTPHGDTDAAVRKRPLYRYEVETEAVDYVIAEVIAHNKAEAIEKARHGEVEDQFGVEEHSMGRTIRCDRGERVDLDA